MIKKGFLLTALWAFITVSFFTVSVKAEIPDPVGNIYVQDHAGILSSEDKKELAQLGEHLNDKTKAQISVLTVKGLDGKSVEEYAVDAFRKFQLGDKKLNNGVLLLIDTKGRHIRIEVGYGLEGALPDGKVGRILDEYAIPYLKDEQPAKAAVNTYKKLYNEVALEYKIDDKTNPKPYESSQGLPLWQIMLIAAALLILITVDIKFFGGTFTYLILNIASAFFRNGGGGGGGNQKGGGGSSGGGGASRNW
ncbi:TPM domain-containing protein [Heyndrickxia acidicola]|uniref:TPM domain-containing protein n=1 Tax=Heyndrickxia acidicola TaxID=209389 RepID=A0ABU6MH02_9BACI|nr:TPM domain-containing protein [Heyndrickxia acidicola]MED1202933.1 TPM domain-containing protein [Heyndrickxia acidicola]